MAQSGKRHKGVRQARLDLIENRCSGKERLAQTSNLVTTGGEALARQC